MPAYLAWEAGRREGLRSLRAETVGRLEVPLAPGHALLLTARADRIELDGRGGGAIVDFKTGKPPTDRETAVGFSPQLTLEAAILMRGGFAEVPDAARRAVPRLDYVKIGGRVPLEPFPVLPPRGDSRSLDAIVGAHIGGLEDLVRRYAVEGAGYRSRPYPQYARRFSPYDHLSRVKEWSLAGEEEEEAAG